MKKLLFFLYFIFLVAPFSFSQVLEYPGGTITTPVEWTGYDTVYVTGDIIIQSGSLTISPNPTSNCTGTYIVFLDNYGISVIGNGSLFVNGTPTENIYFTVDRPEDGFSRGDKSFGETDEIWKNLLFDSSTGSSAIKYSVIEYGTGDEFGAGGGIDIFKSNVSVENTIIRNCNISGDGGGLYIETASGNVSLKNLTIYNNTATNNGGGIFANGPMSLDRSVVFSNDATEGDGIYINSPSIVTNSIIHGNSGDGAYTNDESIFTNCVFYSNEKGIRLGYESRIINCNIINNIDGIVSNSFNAPKIVNTVLWGNNTEYLMEGATDKLEFANCAIEGGLTGVAGEINGGNNKNLSSTNNADTGPNFINPSGSDFHIDSRVAPMVDEGAESYSGIAAPITDIDNSPRIGKADIGAYEFFYYMWTGAVSTSWSVPGNWQESPSSIPLSFSEDLIKIPDGCLHYPVFTGNLTLSSRSLLIIDPRAQLTVSGVTTVNPGSKFLLRSTAEGTATFICGVGTSTVVGSFSIEMFLSGGGSPNNKWHYFTSPVDYHSTNLLTTDINNLNLLTYREQSVTINKDQGWQWFDGYNSTTGFSQLRFRKGYNVYVPTNKTVVFNGLIWPGKDVSWTNTELTCTGTNPNESGWNLIGNPFTCPVDAEAFVFGSDLLGPDPLDRVIYFTQDNGFVSYNSYTHAGIGASRYVPALQGFFVHAKGGGRTKSLKIPYSARVSLNSALYKGASAEEYTIDYPFLKINISDGTSSSDETIVYFFNDATTLFDGLYDGYKLFSKNAAIAQIYTVSNGIKLCMNALPLPEATCSIPLKIKVGETKNYTINVLNLENLDQYKVSLVNGENETDLKTTHSYTFPGTAGTTLDMTLVFDDITTDIPDIASPSVDKMNVWYQNGFVYLKTDIPSYENNAIISIYDINGSKVYSKNIPSINKGQVTEIPLELPNGIYICKVNAKLITNSRKLVVVR
jgi:predicted outer membrane repeat protein